MESLFTQYLGFAGVGVLVSLVIMLLKLPALLSKGKYTLLPDGWAGNVQVLLNTLLFVGFVVTKTFYPDIDFVGLDEEIGIYANYLLQLIGLVLQISGSRLAYVELKKASPDVSYTNRLRYG